MISLEQQIDLYHYLQGFLTEERKAKIEKYADESSDFVLPVMEDIYQFRNAAAIVRSVEACGFHKIIALENENEFNPNTRVTRGADTWVAIEKRTHNQEALQELKQQGYQILAISPEERAVNIEDYALTQPVALVFGTEKQGVSQEIIESADAVVKIPMYGFTESFNVSVAAGICMYVMKQKLLHSEIDFRLPLEKKMALKIRWAVNSARSGEEILQDYLQKKGLKII